MNRIEIESFWYKQHKHLINDKDESTGVDTNQPRFVLTDAVNFRVYAVCRHVSSAASLSGYSASFNMTSREDNRFDMKLNTIWRYVYTPKVGRWQEDYAFSNENQLQHAILMNQKAYALDRVYDCILHQWQWNLGHDATQAAIYLAKYAEAKEVLSRRIEADSLCDFPYVTSYANLKGIPLVEAAKLIKFQHDMQASFLAELENLRLKYKNLICAQQDMPSLRRAYDQFMNQLAGYGSL